MVAVAGNDRFASVRRLCRGRRIPDHEECWSDPRRALRLMGWRRCAHRPPRLIVLCRRTRAGTRRCGLSFASESRDLSRERSHRATTGADKAVRSRRELDTMDVLVTAGLAWGNGPLSRRRRINGVGRLARRRGCPHDQCLRMVCGDLRLRDLVRNRFGERRRPRAYPGPNGRVLSRRTRNVAYLPFTDNHVRRCLQPG